MRSASRLLQRETLETTSGFSVAFDLFLSGWRGLPRGVRRDFREETSRQFLSLALASFVMLALTASPALSCPLCPGPTLTLAEQLAQADAVALVQWIEGEKASATSDGQTVYEIKQVTRNFKDSLKAGNRLSLPPYRVSAVGNLFLLTGRKGNGVDVAIEWGSPLEVTETSFAYITQGPAPEVPTSQRLKYYLKFLEYPDELISNDAYGEFANAPYRDIVAVSEKLSRERLRKWIGDSKTPETRLGLYGLLIGLCGNSDDAALLESKIMQKTADLRLGIDGLIAGYLLLRGANGLDLIDKSKLLNRDIPFSETFAAMQALQFMWQYAEGRIEPDRLKLSMRILLERPELFELVVPNLARWKDWTVQDRLMTIYLQTLPGSESASPSARAVDQIFAALIAERDGQKSSERDASSKAADKTPDPDDVASIKKAIIRYMLVSSKDVPDDAASGDASPMPAHVATGLKYLEMLRKVDPQTVRSAERYFFLN